MILQNDHLVRHFANLRINWELSNMQYQIFCLIVIPRLIRREILMRIHIWFNLQQVQFQICMRNYPFYKFSTKLSIT